MCPACCRRPSHAGEHGKERRLVAGSTWTLTVRQANATSAEAYCSGWHPLSLRQGRHLPHPAPILPARPHRQQTMPDAAPHCSPQGGAAMPSAAADPARAVLGAALLVSAVEAAAAAQRRAAALAPRSINHVSVCGQRTCKPVRMMGIACRTPAHRNLAELPCLVADTQHLVDVSLVS